MENGEYLVFEYVHSGAHCDDIYDDEWAEILTFEIDKNLTEFEFTDDEIAQSKCFYNQYGAWVAHHNYPVTEGRIRGNKTSETYWEITIDITVRSIEGAFIKQIQLNRLFQKN